MPNCQVCGRALAPAVRGRPPTYCSRACRARAYRERVSANQEQFAAPVEAVVPGLSLDRVVRAAIELVDRDGAFGLSMRHVAAELGVGAMSLYRYVPGKEELGRLMIDAVFGDHPLPEPGPPGWRAKLELSARREWQIYLDHPWVPQLFALTTRPPIAPSMMGYTDWRIRAVDDLGLDFPTMVRIAIMVGTHTQSSAYPLAREQFARHSREQWLGARDGQIRQALAAGTLPMIARFGADALDASQPESIFEFGLCCLLDGVDGMIADRDVVG
ncbi:TetR/AcrR family transcriptional regulator [Nocardia panacis]|uniref:TetR/AcrR family transcriptional regulator n=1 Tax=Nocardia panacis TaxID=2340916 RepID=A0A3A4K562_9NOCA|nr:TetR/AcrR family transcriptional regulator [Nocardia panacis]RJO73611.1 TetR/AcrR family transcriptional regulator [Nocardia panacis]